MKSKTIRIPIYFGKLTLIYTDNLEKLNEIYDTKIDDSLYDAVVFQPLNQNKCVLAIKSVDWSVIAHEVVHIVNHIFLQCGIELDRVNDEPQAYLTGWVINEIDKFLKEV